jgi:hypothetical protein
VSFEDTDMSWRADSGTANTAEDRIIAEMGPYENYIIGAQLLQPTHLVLSCISMV